MDQSSVLPAGEAIERVVQSRTAELERMVEELHKENQQLGQKNDELTHRPQPSSLEKELDRDSRRAAFNLMEDAVDARKEAQEENLRRRQIEDELREVNRRKDEFLAILAHELRTPLAPLRSSLYMLRLVDLQSDAADSAIQIMERQVEHMVRLINDLMDVSRISRGLIELRTEPLDLIDLIKVAVDACRSSIDAAHHQLEISVPAEPLVVLADPVRMTQVITNLLNNAIKYTHNGGHIGLEAKRDQDRAVLHVKDSGIGVPPEMLAKIFDPFTQVDCNTQQAQGGLGIGLSLVRDLLSLHEGTIEVASDGQVGHGSEFVMRLPLIQATVPTTTHREPPNPTEAKITPCQILVVDDSIDAAETLSVLLRVLGAEVKTAYSGAAALRTLESFKPTIVLLDIGMPQMNGYEVCRKIRNHPDLADVMLVALTGWGQDGDRLRTKEAGFHHHLVKPVELDALADIISLVPGNS